MDLTVDGASALSGGAKCSSALHSMALAKVEWQQVSTADKAPTLHFFASALNLAGRGPTENIVSDSLGVSNMEGFASTRL